MVEVFQSPFNAVVNDISADSDPDEDLIKLVNCMYGVYVKVFPLKKRSKKQAKLYRKPWITKGILTSMKIRDELKLLWLKTKDEETHLEYKKYRNKVTRIKEKAKALFDNEEYSKCEGDSKKTWRKINTDLGRSKTKSSLPSKLCVNWLATTNY